MKTAYIFLANGFEESEAIFPIDLLRRSGIIVHTVSISDNKTVIGAHNIPIIADQTLSNTDTSQADLLILPGGMPGTTNLNANENLKKAIVEHNKKNKLIAAICAAPSVLGGLGLLQNKRAVCYPGFENMLTDAIVGTDAVCCDGNIITARGAGCVIQFALQIIECLQGKEASDAIAKTIVFRN